MNKIDKIRLKKMIDKSDSIIIATDKGTAQIGYEPELLACLTSLIKELNQKLDIDKESLQLALDLAFKTDEELSKIMLEKMTAFMNELMNKKEADDETI